MTIEPDDPVIRFTDLSKKGIVMPARKVDAGIPVVRSVDLSGKGVVFPASKIEPGDNVIRLPDLSGKGIVVRADGGADTGPDLEDVDPCKSLKLTLDPNDPKYFFLDWVPGDNNDNVHYEISTYQFVTKHDGSGEASATWPIYIKSAQKRAIRYLTWHFVTIWGKRGTRFSKIYLKAQILMPLTIVLPFMNAHITTKHSQWPVAPRDYVSPGVGTGSWDPGADPWAVTPARLPFSKGFDGPTYHDPYHCAWLRVDWSPGYGWPDPEPPAWWYKCPVRATITCCPKTYENPPGDNPAYGGTVSSSGIEEFGVNPRILEVTDLLIGDYAGPAGTFWYDWVSLISVTMDNAPHIELDSYNNMNISYWFAAQPSGASAVSWDVFGDDLPPPQMDYNSGVLVCDRYHGGLPDMDLTLYFYDGSGACSGFERYDMGYIALRICDPDNGVLFVKASVPGYWSAGKWYKKGRDMQLNFGDIELCNNYDRMFRTYWDGYLGISLIELDD